MTTKTETVTAPSAPLADATTAPRADAATAPRGETAIEGLDTARFECVYPTCGGICCVNGRPPVEAGEERRIGENLSKFLPHLRPEARERILAKGFLTNRIKEGLRSIAVSRDWCVFHNDGCVLHKVGLAEGDKWKYKPWRCIAFPLERSPAGKWHVRQWGVRGEAWDVFCLNPEESPKTARETLAAEVEFVQAFESGAEAWRMRAEPDAPARDERACERGA